MVVSHNIWHKLLNLTPAVFIPFTWIIVYSIFQIKEAEYMTGSFLFAGSTINAGLGSESSIWWSISTWVNIIMNILAINQLNQRLMNLKPAVLGRISPRDERINKLCRQEPRGEKIGKMLSWGVGCKAD